MVSGGMRQTETENSKQKPLELAALAIKDHHHAMFHLQKP
jgi:hypothetical protein